MVVSPRFHKEIREFDRLRNKLKTTKLSNKTESTSVEIYRSASANLRDHLIREYQESKKNLGINKTKPMPVGTIQVKNLQHKVNVLKRILYHEWRVELQD